MREKDLEQQEEQQADDCQYDEIDVELYTEGAGDA